MAARALGAARSAIRRSGFQGTFQAPILGGLQEASEPPPERPLRVGFGARDGLTAPRAVSGSETYSKWTFWRGFGSLLQTSENALPKRTLTETYRLTKI